MKKVLVTPLDWGLGHATRCIPIIRALLKRPCEVVLGGSGDSLVLLRKEFPSLKYVQLPGYDPIYPTSGSMVRKMAMQLTRFIRVIAQEHQQLEKIIHEHDIDCVISDNRYGCWSSHVPSVLVTHQSNILMPKRFGWLQGMVKRASESRMKKFTICWIPDDPAIQLAGKLVPFEEQHVKFKMRYIGLLSRFHAGPSKIKYDLAAIFSGPEPQRTLLENIVLGQLEKSNMKYFVVRGLPASENREDDSRVRNYMITEDLQDLINTSAIILARSGYSTVMDMAAMGKKVILIPTPGQTEQEYLAEMLSKKKIAFSTAQKDFDLEKALRESKNFSGFKPFADNGSLLTIAIDELLSL
jgi:uncharacterized protein (TIGR00661 family)